MRGALPRGIIGVDERFNLGPGDAEIRAFNRLHELIWSVEGLDRVVTADLKYLYHGPPTFFFVDFGFRLVLKGCIV
jgi:hypothetical protein